MKFISFTSNNKKDLFGYITNATYKINLDKVKCVFKKQDTADAYENYRIIFILSFHFTDGSIIEETFQNEEDCDRIFKMIEGE